MSMLPVKEIAPGFGSTGSTAGGACAGAGPCAAGWTSAAAGACAAAGTGRSKDNVTATIDTLTIAPDTPANFLIITLTLPEDAGSSAPPQGARRTPRTSRLRRDRPTCSPETCLARAFAVVV